MADIKTIALPLPSQEFDRNNEAVTRRLIEQAIQDINVRITLLQYIYYDKSVAANDSLAIVLGITLNQTDVIKVYTSAVDMSFNMFGCETTEER
jgi:hypothetical protein